MRSRAPKPIDVQAIPLLSLPSVPFAERQRLPRCAAIYFVLNAQGTVLYIGQSINLAVRWNAHHRTAKLDAQLATRIAWLVMDDASLLDAVESACIAYFDPVCNGLRGPINRHRRSPTRYEHLTIRCPEGLLDQWREAARRHDRSLNAEIVRALRQALEGGSEDEPLRTPYRPRRASAASF